MKTLRTPISRSEFEHNIALVIEDAKKMSEAKKREFDPSLGIIVNELKALRTLPNGRINFHTVDESLRLHANTLNSRPFLDPLYDKEDV